MLHDNLEASWSMDFCKTYYSNALCELFLNPALSEVGVSVRILLSSEVRRSVTSAQQFSISFCPEKRHSQPNKKNMRALSVNWA